MVVGAKHWSIATSPTPKFPVNLTSMPRKRPNRNFLNIPFRVSGRQLPNFDPIIRGITSRIAPFRQKLISPIRRIRKRDQHLAIILLVLWILLLFGNFYIRGISRFEGNLITKTISFIYTGEIDKQFLKSLNIPKLTLQGQQPNPLALKGKFTSSDPTLNAKLQSLSQLQIQLSTPTSSLTIEPKPAKSPQLINFQQLRITPNAQIASLIYRTHNHQLQFCLESHTSSTSAHPCESPDNAGSTSSPVGELELSLNPIATNLILSNVKIPALAIEDSILETQLTWQPEGQDLTLEITSPTSLQIGLPKIDKNTPEDIVDDLTQFIRGDIPVQHVRFTHVDRTGNVNDDILTSEILEGEVRMAGQSLKLQNRQFLIIPSNRDFDKFNCQVSPHQNLGIQRIRDIHLNLKDPKGIQTLFSGESKCLGIGLYERFPTQSIEPSWLLKYLPQEGINAIYTLIGAFTGILFPRLFPEDDESKPPSQKD